MRVAPCLMQPSSVSFARVIDVLDREGGLHRLHAAHVVRLAAARLGRAAVDDPRLVEMDVGLDQPGAAEAALGIVGRGVGLNVRLDGRDPPVAEADVDESGPPLASARRALRMTRSSMVLGSLKSLRAGAWQMPA